MATFRICRGPTPRCIAAAETIPAIAWILSFVETNSVASRLSLRILTLTAVMLLACGTAQASPHDSTTIPEASALVLAPIGIAAVVAAERRRRRLANVKRGVGKAYFFVKRVFDLTTSSIVLLLSSPILLALAVLVRIDSPGPVIFKRRVVGINGVEFDMYKFRSMVEGAERILKEDEKLKNLYSVNWKLETDPRITRLGALLRRTSLDELPQLINVFLGNMTFVGPRPIAPDEVERYGPMFSVFTTVKPGITGLWQTCGRSETSYEKRVEMDMLYIDKRSILLDTWIVLSTIPAVLLKRGAM